MKQITAIVFLLGSSLFIPAAAWSAQLIVVEARGVGFAPGASVDSTKTISLKEGQHLTLISPAGTTIKLDGPFNGAPETAQSGGVDISQKLAALTAGGERLAEVGTTRGTQTATLPSPWLLDVGHSGPACLEEGQAPVLWREAAAGATEITIMPDDQSWRATVEWPAGTDALALVAAVPLHAGMTYYIDMNGERRAINVVSVPTTLTSDQMRAAWLANKGCEAQAKAMLRSPT